MEEKKLTDEEIVKALEHCATENTCRGCVKYNGETTIDYFKCMRDTRKNVVDLFHRLQTENERLKSHMKAKEIADEHVRKMRGTDLRTIAELQKQVDVLTAEKENLYFLNKNLEDYIDNHEPIWKRNTEQAVKDTAKEIFSFIVNQYDGEYFLHNVEQFIAEKYGVEVE